ncbi:MAG: DUF89 family protein [Deltaproteobacteria bacterium]|nr:DUF89 family protein [Deltaproteobacteria bacterium]
MLITPDCIPCILRMSVTAMRALNLDADRSRGLYRKIARHPGLLGETWDVVSPSIIEGVMEIMEESLGASDPFSTLKRMQNKQALEVEPELESMIQEEADPLHLAVRLAILGNMIDLMVPNSLSDFMQWIQSRIQDPISEGAYNTFRERLARAGLVVYLCDNAGEIVFDKQLIKTIRRLYSCEIVFVVRSVPALNDVTLREAEDTGMKDLVPVVENGIDGPFPGTMSERCSREARDLFRRADLIVSKGGGNFDSLTEEKPEILEKTSFLLLSKCDPYCDLFGTKLFEPVLAHFP